METVHNNGAILTTRKKLNEANHELTLLEGEKGILPTQTFLQRKQDLKRQVALMQEALNDFYRAKTVMVY